MERKTVNPWIAFFLVVCLGLVGFVTVDLSEQNRIEEQARSQTLEHLTRLRTNVETTINSAITLTQGLAMHVQLQGYAVDDDIAKYAVDLIERVPTVRSMSVSDQWQITHIFPPAGNEAAIGMNYLNTATQREAAVRAVRERTTVLAGPVELVQGGQALIGRIPVFGGPDKLDFLGIVGVVMHADKVFEDIKKDAETDWVDIAIRGVDGKGAEGDMIFGDEMLFDAGGVFQDIQVPGGVWQLVGQPSPKMLETLSGRNWIIRILAWVAIVMMGATAYFIARYIQQQHVTIDYQSRIHNQIQHMSTHDDLTGLANRALFSEELHLATASAKRSRSRLAVLFLDLDNFMEINDGLGHHWGDRLLVQVCERITATMPDNALVARLGGDEFAILLHAIYGPDEAALLVQDMLTMFDKPFILDGKPTFVSASVGISVYPNDGTDADNMLRHADLAMYAAKEARGSSYSFYETEMNDRVQGRRAFEADIAKALANQDFQLVYQPKIDPRTDTVQGFEALIRWNHPVRGWVSPNDLIAAAETSGQIKELGTWVLKEACRQTVLWRRSGFGGLHIAVNLSPVQFLEENLPKLIHDVLVETQLDPTALDLEITEGAIMKDVDAAANMLGAIRGLGVAVSLDDFGTGYSSLGYLRRFPVDRIKVDTSFTRDIGAETGVEAIIESVVALSNALDIGVTVEGVETKPQLDFVATLGVDEVQGYYYSKPLDPDHVPEFLMRMSVAKRPNGLSAGYTR